MKNCAAAIEEDDVPVVDARGGAAGDGFFCFDVRGRFDSKRKGRVRWCYFYSAAVGALKEAIDGQLIEVSSDSDLRDFQGDGHRFDLCLAGFGQRSEYGLFSFLKIHVIRLFLSKIDQN